MTTAKNEVFIGLYNENCYLVGRRGKTLVGVYWGYFSRWERGGEWTNIQLVGVICPILHYRNPCLINLLKWIPSRIFFNKLHHIIQQIQFAEYLDVNAAAWFVNMNSFFTCIKYQLKNYLTFHVPTSLASVTAKMIWNIRNFRNNSMETNYNYLAL